MDEMWSFYHDKSHQIWLWWAVDHATNTPLAFTFGTREHKNLDVLLDLLKPFPIGKVYADHNFAYEKRIPTHQLVSGKKNTQKIERGFVKCFVYVILCRFHILVSQRHEADIMPV